MGVKRTKHGLHVWTICLLENELFRHIFNISAPFAKLPHFEMCVTCLLENELFDHKLSTSNTMQPYYENVLPTIHIFTGK